MIARSAVRALVCLLLFASTVVASAQDRGRGRSEAPPPKADAREEKGNVETEAEVVDASGERVKVFRFSGLDISGRLKSPQLLYFLNRLRAEFGRPRLPHRSFLPEVELSTKSEEF